MYENKRSKIIQKYFGIPNQVNKGNHWEAVNAGDFHQVERF